MRRLVIAFALLLCWPIAAWCQVNNPPTVELKDEGTSQGRVVSLNCVGSGVTCSVSGFAGTLTASGGGSGNFLEISINLGTSGGLVFSVTVTGQAWVTATSDIVCSPFATAADGLTIETVQASGIQAMASNRVAATGFDLGVYSPHGATGTYRFHCSGA